MYKKICLLILLECFIFSQISAQSSFFIKNNNIEKWYIEKDKIADEVKKVLNLSEFHAVTNGNIPIEELLPYFHFIDFDNNGTADLIFSGKIANKFYTFIFYKKDNEYLVAMGEKGNIAQTNLPYMDNGLHFSLWTEACCGEYIHLFRQYACINTTNTSYFNTISKSLIYAKTVLPQIRLEKPVAFKIEKAGNVRNEPFVDDNKLIRGMHSWRGNTLGAYPPNATGTIFAEMRNDKNEFWYFVRMNNESGISIQSNRFTAEDEDKYENCFTYGWIHSSEVTLIE